MSKHNRAKLEKADRNKIYADKFVKDDETKEKPKKKVPIHVQADPDITWPNWCRVQGHPSSCSCVYPTYDEVIAASRRR